MPHRYRCVYTSTYRIHHNQPHTNTHTQVCIPYTHTHTHAGVHAHGVYMHTMCMDVHAHGAQNVCTHNMHLHNMYTNTETTNTQHCVIMTQDTHVSNQEYIKYIHTHVPLV